MFNTEIVEAKDVDTPRYSIRFMSNEDFLRDKASGTLRKNSKLGFRFEDQLNAERVAYEFGYSFESVPSTRITFNDAITCCDDSAITYSGWVAERYITLQTAIFQEDQYEIKYLIVERPDGKREEGIALMVRRTSFPFVRKGHIVFSFLALYDTLKKEYVKVANFS